MKLLHTFHEQDVFTWKDVPSTPLSSKSKRDSVRCLLFNKKQKVFLAYFPQLQHHIIIGGGIHNNETIEQALHREVREETGYQLQNIQELGIIVHEKTSAKQLETQYCYIAQTTWEKQDIQHSPWEQKKEMRIETYTLDQALLTLKKDAPLSYHGHFYSTSWLRLLQYVQNLDIAS